MQGARAFNTDEYKYGFNGKENDKETSTQDYGLRIYNPALGKFLSVDPLAKEYPWNSTFAFAENSPIENIDLDGAEKYNFRLTNNNGQAKLELLDIQVTETVLGVEYVPRERYIVEYEGLHYSFPEYIDAPGNANEQKFADFVLADVKPAMLSDEEHDEMVATGSAAAFTGQDPLANTRTSIKSTIGNRISTVKPQIRTQQSANNGVKVDGSKTSQWVINGKVSPDLVKKYNQLNKKQRNGQDFTKAGKKVVKDINTEVNKGQMKCVNCGQTTYQGKKDMRGVKPPGNRADVDHVNRKADDGSGTPENGDVLCHDCNMEKH